MKSLPRRLILILPVLLLASTAPSQAELFKRKNKDAARQEPLAPGQYEWHPERAPEGPILMVVSIDDQIAYVYRNGVQIARSTVSTGAPGHDTPTGVFTILEKHKDHESNIYKGAKMPNMQRLTWSGICMHAGQLPGYPASHGCVRLPLEFSERLFTVTDKGGTVVVTKKGAVPAKSDKPASVLLATKLEEGSQPTPAFVGKTIWTPERSPSGPVNLVLSGKDSTMYVYRNGILIGQSPVYLRDTGEPLPSGVFLLLEGTEQGIRGLASGRAARPWTTLSLDENSSRHPVEDLRARLEIPDDFARKVYDVTQAGTILLTTPETNSEEHRSDTNFTILN